MYHCWETKIILLALGAFYVSLNAQENNTETVTSTTTNLTLDQNNVTQNSTERLRFVSYCLTPNNDTGHCMPVMNCTKLSQQLENKKAKNFLRKSRCGPKNENKNNPLVCCGKYNNYKHLVTSDSKNLLPKTCGYENVTSIKGRILGGNEAVLGEFPWLARLYHKDKAGAKVFGCSGFLISSKYVLTAGHCLKSENNNILGPVFEVHLGEHDTNTSPDCNSRNICAEKVQIIRIDQNIVHPSYNMTSRHHHHDIGLIHLKKGVKLTAFVSPICLFPKMDFEPFEYWLGGWGSTETEHLSHIKMKVSVPPYRQSNCTKLYSKLHVKIFDKQLCAGGKKNKDSCTGDSGGPLMLVVNGNHWFAAGVVSYGLGCGREGWPAIYTNITSYGDWINNTMVKLSKGADKVKTKSIKSLKH